MGLDRDRSRLVRLAISFSLPECAAVVSMLRGYGIPATVESERSVNIGPAMFVALGGLRIWVPGFHYADALALLRSAEPYEPYHARGNRRAIVAVTLLLFILVGFVPPPRMRLDLGGWRLREARVADGPDPTPA